jgi:hypothetical protein
MQMSLASMPTGVTIEKKIATISANATFIRTGMAAHPKTGSTIKNAETLVSTIIKPSSFSPAIVIDSAPDILDMAENFVNEPEHYLQRPATAQHRHHRNGQKLGDYRYGHIANGSNCLKQRYHHSHNDTGQENRRRQK